LACLLLAHHVISLRCGIRLLTGHSGLWRAIRPADLWVHGPDLRSLLQSRAQL